MENESTGKKPLLAMLVMLGVLAIGFVFIAVHLNYPGQVIENVDSDKAFDLVERNRDNRDFIVLDIRTPEEFQTEHIEGAVNLDYYSDSFKEELCKLDKGKTYLVYCRRGERTERALPLFRECRFRRLYVMPEGLKGWVELGFPTVK